MSANITSFTLLGTRKCFAFWVNLQKLFGVILEKIGEKFKKWFDDKQSLNLECYLLQIDLWTILEFMKICYMCNNG